MHIIIINKKHTGFEEALFFKVSCNDFDSLFLSPELELFKL